MAARACVFLVEFLGDVFALWVLSPGDGRCPTDERWAPATGTGSAAFFLPPELLFGVRAEWLEDAALRDAVEPVWAPSRV